MGSSPPSSPVLLVSSRILSSHRDPQLLQESPVSSKILSSSQKSSATPRISSCYRKSSSFQGPQLLQKRFLSFSQESSALHRNPQLLQESSTATKVFSLSRNHHNKTSGKYFSSSNSLAISKLLHNKFALSIGCRLLSQSLKVSWAGLYLENGDPNKVLCRRLCSSVESTILVR